MHKYMTKACGIIACFLHVACKKGCFYCLKSVTDPRFCTQFCHSSVSQVSQKAIFTYPRKVRHCRKPQLVWGHFSLMLFLDFSFYRAGVPKWACSMTGRVFHFCCFSVRLSFEKRTKRSTKGSSPKHIFRIKIMCVSAPFEFIQGGMLYVFFYPIIFLGAFNYSW